MSTAIPVDPVHPPAPYIGGKRALAARIIERINRTPHTGYAEPFVGMGGVFFRRNQRSKTEVINDINGEVANLFRILQRHYPHFMDTLKFQVTSRREFERLARCDPSTLTDLERAARFLYLQRTTFGGKVVGQSFGVARHESARFNLTRLGPVLEEVHERMAGVVIECLGWAEFLDRWDRKGMLFYLDPPYWNGETDYGKGVFSRTDFAALAERLRRLKGRFILSINDLPEVREVFSGFKLAPVSLTYTVTSGKATPAKELLVTG